MTRYIDIKSSDEYFDALVDARRRYVFSRGANLATLALLALRKAFTLGAATADQFEYDEPLLDAFTAGRTWALSEKDEN